MKSTKRGFSVMRFADARHEAGFFLVLCPLHLRFRLRFFNFRTPKHDGDRTHIVVFACGQRLRRGIDIEGEEASLFARVFIPLILNQGTYALARLMQGIRAVECG